jgi:hypothetical protein
MRLQQLQPNPIPFQIIHFNTTNHHQSYTTTKIIDGSTADAQSATNVHAISKENNLTILTAIDTTPLSKPTTPTGVSFVSCVPSPS